MTRGESAPVSERLGAQWGAPQRLRLLQSFLPERAQQAAPLRNSIPEASMADIQPFRAFRYDTQRVALKDVLTQPYDKIISGHAGALLRGQSL